MATGWLAVSLASCLALGVSAAGCAKSDPKQDETARVNRNAAPTEGGARVTGAPGGAAPAAMPPTGGPGAAPAAPTADDPNDTSFQFEAQQPAPGKAGTEAVARFVISPGTGYKMNKEYPTKLTLEPPAGVTVAKTVLELGDAESFSDKGLTFAVKLTAAQPGEFTIPATVKFAVCTDATCDPKKKKVALVMKAE